MTNSRSWLTVIKLAYYYSFRRHRAENVAFKHVMMNLCGFINTFLEIKTQLANESLIYCQFFCVRGLVGEALRSQVEISCFRISADQDVTSVVDRKSAVNLTY